MKSQEIPEDLLRERNGLRLKSNSFAKQVTEILKDGL